MEDVLKMRVNIIYNIIYLSGDIFRRRLSSTETKFGLFLENQGILHIATKAGDYFQRNLAKSAKISALISAEIYLQ